MPAEVPVDTQSVWTDAQFEQMSWHDNHVHGMRVVEGQHGAGLLVLDLDYITEWVRIAGEIRFRIVPATLTFHDVTNLRVTLDYATPMAGLVPFSIDRIERIAEPRERYTAIVWKVAVNWPVGELTFEAGGYEQRARNAAVLVDRQYLTPTERNDRA